MLSRLASCSFAGDRDTAEQATQPTHGAFLRPLSQSCARCASHLLVVATVEVLLDAPGKLLNGRVKRNRVAWLVQCNGTLQAVQELALVVVALMPVVVVIVVVARAPVLAPVVLVVVAVPRDGGVDGGEGRGIQGDTLEGWGGEGLLWGQAATEQGRGRWRHQWLAMQTAHAAVAARCRSCRCWGAVLARPA